MLHLPSKNNDWRSPQILPTSCISFCIILREGLYSCSPSHSTFTPKATESRSPRFLPTGCSSFRITLGEELSSCSTSHIPSTKLVIHGIEMHSFPKTRKAEAYPFLKISDSHRRTMLLIEDLYSRSKALLQKM